MLAELVGAGLGGVMVSYFLGGWRVEEVAFCGDAWMGNWGLSGMGYVQRVGDGGRCERGFGGN